ncbi:MAG: hypothetical protein RL197_157 [Actinomycetota bacterium]|jgi:hypothetical protein
MSRFFKSATAVFVSISLAVSAPFAASAAINPEVVDNGLTSGSSVYSGTFTNVTTTLGSDGRYYDNGTSPIYFSTDASSSFDNSWVRWTFSTPVTQVRVYYAYVESTAYSGNSGDNDPQAWTTSRGNVNFLETSAGGNKTASGGEVISGQPEAGLSGNIANCQAPATTCSGYVDLLFPQGISWIETTNSNTGAGPGFNGVGLALDAGEQGAPEEEAESLANTGANLALAWYALATVLLGLWLIRIRRREPLHRK